MNDRVIELAEFFELVDESPDGTVCIVDRAVVDGSLILQRTILGDDLVGDLGSELESLGVSDSGDREGRVLDVGDRCADRVDYRVLDRIWRKFECEKKLDLVKILEILVFK